MARKILGLMALLLCLTGLSGCVFSSVEEMYALPKSSEAYVNLQAKINTEKGNAEYIAPLSGENRQTIQLVDVDGDGVQEAVAFFRDAQAEANGIDKPAKAVRRNLAADDARNAVQLRLTVKLRFIGGKRNSRPAGQQRSCRTDNRLAAAIAAAAVVIEHDFLHRLIPHLFPVSFSLMRIST